MDVGQVRIAAPSLQPLPDAGVGLRVAVVEPLAAPSEVLAEPVEGLPAQENTFMVVQLVSVLALAATRQRGHAGGKVAVGRGDVFGQRGLCGEGIGVESGCCTVEALELTTRELARQQGHALVIVPRSVLSAPEGRQVPEDQALGFATE